MRTFVHDQNRPRKSFHPPHHPARGATRDPGQIDAHTPGDAFESEADRVAARIMQMSHPVQRKCACGGGCPRCQAEYHPTVKPAHAAIAGSGSDGATETPPLVDNVLRTPGRPLDTETRAFMESRFSHDFGDVRMHTDDAAAKSARAIGALAYTFGRHIAWGQNQYAPRTSEGRRLLAHELTHVLHQAGGSPAVQRQAVPEPTTPRTTPAYAVTTSGCDQLPYDKKYVEGAARRTFDEVKDGNCIGNESLKNDVLEKLANLKIVCQQGGAEGPCGEGVKPDSFNLYEASRKTSLCPSRIEPVILHEAVHLTESFSFYHGNLSYDCAESCFPGEDPLKRGDPSKCTFERSALPSLGASAGLAFTGKGDPTSYFRLYAGFDKRRPILSFIDGSLGIGVSLIGATDAGRPGSEPSGRSALISLIGALRFDPGKIGGGYFSVSGGLGFAAKDPKSGLGKEVGVGFGYRWHIYDVSLNAGINYDPTRRAGDEKLYTLSASISFAQKIRP